MDKYDFEEKYEELEATFDRADRRARRIRQGKAGRKPPPALSPELQEAAADDALVDESLFDPTFMRDKKEDKQERTWVIQHLKDFYLEEYITDVLYNVKGGKEASVYCCVAHPTLRVEHVAAKIYRPAVFRSLKNDAIYREGRLAGRESGLAAAALVDGRTWRALNKGTDFGKSVRLETWIGTEYRMMRRLFEAGADIPRPIGHKGHAILMEYLGSGIEAAPTLHHVHLERAEAQKLFLRLLDNVELMLSLECIHGDFSAFNILYWEGQARIIDFPQAIDPYFNQSAYALLERDVTRLCQYFARYRVVLRSGQLPEPESLTRELWQRHMPAEFGIE